MRFSIEQSKDLASRFDGYLAGFRHGKTMAEMGVYYGGLLQEIEALQEEIGIRGAYTTQGNLIIITTFK